MALVSVLVPRICVVEVAAQVILLAIHIRGLVAAQVRARVDVHEFGAVAELGRLHGDRMSALEELERLHGGRMSASEELVKGLSNGNSCVVVALETVLVSRNHAWEVRAKQRG
jgi:hypothetical protein